MNKKIITFLKRKPVYLTLIVIILCGGYYIYQRQTNKTTVTKYMLETVSKGTIISTVSGSGQVSTSNQVDVSPRASGEIIGVYVTEGQAVKTGTLIAQLNAKDALKSVRDAQLNLENAKISLEKLQQPADALTLVQAENALTQAQQAKTKAEDDLKKAYDGAFTDIANAFIDLPGIVTGMDNILYGNSGQDNINYYYDLVKVIDEAALTYKNVTVDSYTAAQNAYDQNFLDYKNAGRYSDNETIEKLLDETYDTTKLLAEAVKNTDNYLSFVNDKLSRNRKPVPSMLTSAQSALIPYLDKVNSHLSSLLASKSSISNLKDTLANSATSIIEKTESLKKIKAGTDVLDLQTAQLSLKQRQNSLLDAQQTLADYTVRAPFDGVIAKVSLAKGDTAGSGSAIATLITEQKIAEIALNEVDVAKVKAGQKVSLFFDAVEDLEITGLVKQIDSIGTVSSGVVSYTVRISFDTQDDRIKSGMSVSATIITDSKVDVSVVPSSAIKLQGGISYVEMLDNPIFADPNDTSSAASETAPRKQTVTVGVSSDTDSEILTGLTEGDKIITQTITETATTQSQTSVLNLLGIGGNRNARATANATTNRGSTGTNINSSGNSQTAQPAFDGPPPGF